MNSAWSAQESFRFGLAFAPRIPEPPRKIVRNMSTPEAQAFWGSVDQSVAEVSTWPDWKKAGVNGNRP